MDIETRVKLVNKELHSSTGIIDILLTDTSLINPAEEKRIENAIGQITRTTNAAKFLDIGTGYGHVLKIAKRYFKYSFGCDLSFYLMDNLKKNLGSLLLVCCEANALAFRNYSFDCVSIFATLHHIFDYNKAVEEAARVIKKGGYLYIDHEPNHYFIRYYHFFLKVIRFFRSEKEENRVIFANFHIFKSKGINAELIKKNLIKFGFSDINIEYRFTTNPNLRFSYAFILCILKLVSYIYPFKSCYTHFSIIAKK